MVEITISFFFVARENTCEDITAVNTCLDKNIQRETFPLMRQMLFLRMAGVNLGIKHGTQK